MYWNSAATLPNLQTGNHGGLPLSSTCSSESSIFEKRAMTFPSCTFYFSKTYVDVTRQQHEKVQHVHLVYWLVVFNPTLRPPEPSTLFRRSNLEQTAQQNLTSLTVRHAAFSATGRMCYRTSLPTRLDGGVLPTRFEYSYSGLSACSEGVRANELEAENEKLRQLSAAESRRANALDAANKELREQVVSLSRALEQAVATGQRNGHGLPEFNAAPQSCESSQSAVSTVFPRRKPGHAKRDCSKDQMIGPVAVTMEILEGLASHSLPTAASKLGISATAMKKACRKLGISRWPYFPARCKDTRPSMGFAASIPAVNQVEIPSPMSFQQCAAQEFEYTTPPPPAVSGCAASTISSADSTPPMASEPQAKYDTTACTAVPRRSRSPEDMGSRIMMCAGTFNSSSNNLEFAAGMRMYRYSSPLDDFIFGENSSGC